MKNFHQQNSKSSPSPTTSKSSTNSKHPHQPSSSLIINQQQQQKQFDSAHHQNNNNLPASIIGLNRHPSTANKHSLGNNFIGKNIPPPSLPSEILTTPTTPTANNQFFTAVNDD
ncbi:hypothetical protein DERP_006641 [Dermatophagoides pteronyssinus]|uniref:Uncharacterized protein n=1 Tax=Dermatophagoides pteronyssinus TaxID=6956 RepID=A0ABQ8IR65_DERPT|nr:hypothetical protein DERP_006641 [Dermatophagoides pteronyssinus]